jgi:hypothetical protein
MTHNGLSPIRFQSFGHLAEYAAFVLARKPLFRTDLSDCVGAAVPPLLKMCA